LAYGAPSDPLGEATSKRREGGGREREKRREGRREQKREEEGKAGDGLTMVPLNTDSFCRLCSRCARPRM